MGRRTCPVCEVTIPASVSVQDHSNTTEHRINKIQKFYTINRSALMAQENGVDISTSYNTDLPPFVKEHEGRISMILNSGCGAEVTVHVVNKNDESAVMLRQCESLYSCPNIRLSDDHDFIGTAKMIKLHKGAHYTFQFKALPGQSGVQELPLVFQYNLKKSHERFYILKLLCVQFVDDVASQNLPKSHFQPLKPTNCLQHPPSQGSFVRGRTANGDKPRPLPMMFSHYYPNYLYELVKCKFDSKRLHGKGLHDRNRRIRKLMQESLRPENYQEWFKTQLWIEEIQREMDLMQFHQINVPLTRSENMELTDRELVQVEVPGLLEKRPHVIIGDNIFIRPTGQEQPCYEGIVHKIFDETVYLGLNAKFWGEFYNGQRVDIQFWYNRTVFVRCHDALKYSETARNVLFPCSSRKECPSVTKPLEFYDHRVANNPGQRQAVEAIVCRSSAPAPYVLFGPPGTGKTLTIVEAIKQVYKLNTDCHVLVSAPSNAACDVIMERLISDIPQQHILRIFATTRETNSISHSIKRVSNAEGEAINMPGLEKLATYRILVTTFMMAARVMPVLKAGSKVRSLFSHVFLDECGNGQEAEALIPLLAVGKMVVLAGDHLQLGPVVCSKICLSDGRFFKNFGLDQSLLERLMKTDLYKAPYNRRYVTKLLDNYRSHADILHIPNELFYNSELRVRGDPTLIDSLIGNQLLQNKRVPLLFHGVNGKDEREGNNPSYFNPHEVSKVVMYVQKLMCNMRVKPEDIGIVAPYRAQIKKIRTALRDAFDEKADNLRVGSPEEFQGGERLVIIVSTVRASAELLMNDVSLQLGFLRNPKRFNVTVTRAQALLVVVGCPWLLQRDKQWGAFLRYCSSKNCYTGCNYEALKKEDVDEVYRKFEDLEIDVAQAEERKTGADHD